MLPLTAVLALACSSGVTDPGELATREAKLAAAAATALSRLPTPTAIAFPAPTATPLPTATPAPTPTPVSPPEITEDEGPNMALIIALVVIAIIAIGGGVGFMVFRNKN